MGLMDWMEGWPDFLDLRLEIVLVGSHQNWKQSCLAREDYLVGVRVALDQLPCCGR